MMVPSSLMVNHLDVRQRPGPRSLDVRRPDFKKLVPGVTDAVQQYLGENLKNEAAFFTATIGGPSPRPFISPCSLVQPQNLRDRIFFFNRSLCWISEETKSCFCSVLLSNLRGQQPHGEHRPSSQEDMEALTSRVGEEISEVCPRSAPGDLPKVPAFKGMNHSWGSCTH